MILRQGRRAAWLRRRVCIALVAAVYVLGGCASPPQNESGTAPAVEQWSGRLGLIVDSDPPEQFHAGFDLVGNPASGQLDLYTPLGSTLASLEWHPGIAVLREGGRTQQFDSVDALAAAAVGTSVPVRALFAWLRGVPQAVDGWQVDLSELAQGRLQARRLQPLPQAQLRLILDPR